MKVNWKLLIAEVLISGGIVGTALLSGHVDMALLSALPIGAILHALQGKDA